MNLTLVDQTLFRLVNKFDGVFDGQDVLVLGAVNVVHHGSQTGGFARTGWSGYQYQSARVAGNLFEHIAHPEVIHTEDLGGNGSEHGASTAILIEGVNPKASYARYFEGEIGFEELFKVLALLIIHDVVDQRVHLLVFHGRNVDPAHVAIHTNHGRQSCRQVQVRRALLRAEG